MDEVGDYLFLQPKLLGDSRPESLSGSGNKSIDDDVRLVSATNRDLNIMVSSEFREDLLYRLNSFHLSIPPKRAPLDLEASPSICGIACLRGKSYSYLRTL